MNENKPEMTPEFIIDLMIRRRWLILLPLSLALIGGIVLAIWIPRTYEAKTLILVEGQRVPQAFVQSIVSEETNERISTISQEILSRTNLEKILTEFSLYSGPEYEDMYIEEKVASLRKDISVNVITDRRRQTDAFEISFKGKDPEKVMHIVNGLANSFINENVKVRESQAIGTSDFLESELETMRLRLEQVEEEIKEYRKTYMGELPEQLETNLRVLERLQDNLSDRQQTLRDAKIRLANLKTQAATRQPSIVVIGGDQRPQEGAVSMDDLVGELESLRSRYTEQHPDIIRIKKQIEELKAGASAIDGSSSAANIPRAIRRQMIEVEREIKLAESEIQNIEHQMAEYQKRVENTPKREQELLSLKRGYENVQTSYDSLLGRKLEADIAVNMERKQKGAQFRIVDPARLPEQPVEPNLRKLFLMIVATGIGAGGGLAFLLEYIDTSFRKPDEVEDVLKLKVIAAIPTIFNPKQVQLGKIERIGSIAYAAVTFGLFAVFGIITIKGI